MSEQPKVTRRVPTDTNRARNTFLISSVVIEHGVAHDRVTIFSRGANSGMLTVNAGDGETIARTLMPDSMIAKE